MTAPAIHVLWTEPHQEVIRTLYGDGLRWCFVCCKRRAFERVTMSPIEPSYYGPVDQIECVVCRTVDGDLFPGRVREWE